MNAVAAKPATEKETLPHGTHEFPNGTFTFANVAKGTHKTIRVKTAKSSNRRWVSLLTGPCNTSDYALIGEIGPGGSLVPHVNKYTGKFTASPEHLKVVLWCLEMLVRPEADRPAGLTIQESRQCVRCNRKLTVPSSISANLGPECASRY